MTDAALPDALGGPIAARPDAIGGASASMDSTEIRARRRPRALLLVWAWELLGALFVATPVAAWARQVFGSHPDGDSPVFRPGGFALMAWVQDEGASLWIVVWSTLLALAFFAIVGQLVTGAVVASLASKADASGRPLPMSNALRAGARAFGPLTAVAVLAYVIELCVIATGIFLGSAIGDSVQASSGDARAFTIGAIVVAIFVALALLVGVVADLVRTSLARDTALGDAAETTLARLRDALVAGVLTARHSLGRAIVGWGWRAALALALVVLGAKLGDLVGDRAGTTLWLLFAAHQLILLARAALRVSWLANALRLLARPTPT